MFQLLLISWIVIAILAVCLFLAKRECALWRTRMDITFKSCGHDYDLLCIDCPSCGRALCPDCVVDVLVADYQSYSCKKEACLEHTREGLRRSAFEAHVTTYKELEQESSSLN